MDMLRLGIITVLSIAVIAVVWVVLSGGGRSVLATHDCESQPGAFALQTYEADSSGNKSWKNVYAQSMDLAGSNQLVPDVNSFALPQVERGNRGAGSDNLVEPYIPPVILKSIGWLESGWMQGCPSVPYGTVGPVLVSHDFGYGIMQITTGMNNNSGVPTLDQVMIGGHYGFNIARGAQILMSKWNTAPELRPLVGQRNPNRVESWYYAIWSYNGFAFSNHPLNPAYDQLRSPYLCDGSQSRSRYPYQELVFGCMKNPPENLWNPVGASLPDLDDSSFSDPLSIGNWGACAGSFNCAQMDIPMPRPTHRDFGGQCSNCMGREGVIGEPKLALSNPKRFNITTLPGQNSKSFTVKIRNTGTGPLVWRLVRSDTWIKLSETQGVALGSDIGPEHSQFTFYVDATDLPADNYVGEIRVRSRFPGQTKVITLDVIVGHRSLVPGVTVS